jgi:DNA-binding NarL/FixJ family response regulator
MALTMEHDIDLVGDAHDVDHAVRLLGENRPHVAIVDMPLGDIGAIRAARRIRSASPKVRLLLRVPDTGPQAVAATQLVGARGYVLRNAAAATVITARLIAEGHHLIGAAETHAAHEWIRQRLRDAEPTRPDGGVREHILALVLAGHTDREIRKKLGVAQVYIETHLAQIVASLR